VDLVLASASPRRRALLEAAGILHRILPVTVDETVPAGVDPADHVRRLAERKARAAARGAGAERAVVLGADTEVVLDGEILGKPADAAEARRVLSRLSDREHRVLTGVFLLDVRAGTGRGRVVGTTVTFRRLETAEIEAYVASGEPFDKAGGYGIQGAAAAFVASRDGPLDNVIGLPVAAVRELIGEVEP
jgi:septum formation protein